MLEATSDLEIEKKAVEKFTLHGLWKRSKVRSLSFSLLTHPLLSEELHPLVKS